MFGRKIVSVRELARLQEQVFALERRNRALADIISRELPKLVAIAGVERTERTTWELRVHLAAGLADRLDRGSLAWRELVAAEVARVVAERMGK